MEGLHHPRPCGCKGIRTCLLCEEKLQAAPSVKIPAANFNLENLWEYCHICGQVQPPSTEKEERTSLTFRSQECTERHTDEGVLLPGILVIPDFISDEEEEEMVQVIDASQWNPSQSGRQKQDYGPKPNFKRKKVKSGGFTGLPPFSKPFVWRMTQLDILKDFKPVEQCHLEYTPERGSSIDLHFDDFWLWGNRLVTINLLSDTYLLLKRDTQTNEGNTNYGSCSLSEESENGGTDYDGACEFNEVLIPMPRKSLLVLSNEARYKWKHAVPRQAITSRRVAVTLRELTPEFLQGGVQEQTGKELLDIALSYEGSVVL